LRNVRFRIKFVTEIIIKHKTNSGRIKNRGVLMKKIVIVYHSGFGHTKLQAEAVHRGAAAVEGAEAVLFTTDEAIKKWMSLTVRLL
jgi:hypothetical protein